MSELKDILGNSGGRLPEEKLLAYLEGRLPEAEQHEVERWLAEEGMEADALEGLNNLSGRERKSITKHINQNLHHSLQGKQRRRSKPLKDNNWAWLAVLIILLLCIVGYYVLHISKQ